jgi:heme/copper-type cytochrome/quinol oxidase subunit 2
MPRLQVASHTGVFMNHPHHPRISLALAAASLLSPAVSFAQAAAEPAYQAASKFNLQPPVSEIASQIYDLHTLVLIFCAVIFVAVFSAMFYAIIYHYLKGEGDLRDVADGIAFYSAISTTYEERTNAKPKEATYLLEVDNRLVVPVGKKVRILTTANDVLHAWWVPALGVKQDAIPGFIRDTWFKADKVGVYRGVCAELCGKEHAFMPIVVEVRSVEDFRAWAAERQKLRTAEIPAAAPVAAAPAAVPAAAPAAAAAPAPAPAAAVAARAATGG